MLGTIRRISVRGDPSCPLPKKSEQSDPDIALRVEAAINRMAPSPPRSSPFAREQMAGVFRARLLDPQWVFEEAYNRFFFLDTKPENAERFKITLEDCLPAPSVP
jgi:hypothetical protein